MATKMNMQHVAAFRSRKANLEERLRDALGVVEALRGEIRGIDHALAVVQGVDPPPSSGRPTSAQSTDRRPRGAVKDIVLGLVTEHAVNGLKTTDVVDFAKEKGFELDRNSVASLLSRLHKEGVLSYEENGRRYRPAAKVAPLRSVI